MATKKATRQTRTKKRTKKEPLKIDKQAPKYDRLPPQNIEAEQSVLGALMLDKDAIIKVSDFLRSEDFYRGVHQSIFEVMVELFEQNEPIDLLSVSNRLEEKEKLKEAGGASYLTDLINTVPSAANVLHYAKIVQKKKLHRDLIDAAHNITYLGYQEIEDVENLVDEAEKRIFAISQRSLRQNFAAIKNILGETYERINMLHRGEGASLRGISTSFTELDNILNGLQKSDLIILASRPGLGKTTLSLDIARHAAIEEGVPVGLFSLEMSSSQIVERVLSAQAEISLQKLRNGKLSENEFETLSTNLDVVSDAPLFIDDAPASTVMEVRTKARRLQAEHGLGLVIVDYVQLMDEPRISTENMVQRITEISRGLKALAKELNIPVLALSQLSRAVEQRSSTIPKLSDLRESGSLEQDADVVIFICGKKEEAKYEKNNQSYQSYQSYQENDEDDKDKKYEQNPNVFKIIVAKHRNGPTGKLWLVFKKEQVRFSNLEDKYEEYFLNET